MSPFELTFTQSLTNMLASGLLVKCLFKETLFSSTPRRLRAAVFVRSLAQSIGFFCLIYGSSLVPLGIFFVVFNSNIFSTAMLSYCWLQERLSKFEIFGMVFAFLGVLIIGLSGGGPSSPDMRHDTYQQTLLMLGLLFAIIAALSQSLIAVSSRVLKQVNFAVIMFNYGLTQALIFGFILLGLYTQNTRLPFNYDSFTTYAELLISNLANVAGLSLILVAYQNANPAIVGMFMYLGVAYNFLADFILFNAQISSMQIVGASISLFFTLAVAVYKMQQDSSTSDNEDNFTRTDTSFKLDIEKRSIQWDLSKTYSGESLDKYDTI